MNHTLQLQAHNAPAVLERLLRVTRHRGFSVMQMQVKQIEKTGDLDIQMTVSGDRPIGVLSRQLVKLENITQATVAACDEIPMSAANNK